MSIAELNTLYTSAAASMDSADWDSAITTLMKMQARLASTPVASRGGSGISHSLRFEPDQLKDLIDFCMKRRAAATAAANTTGPWQTTKVTYKRATTS